MTFLEIRVQPAAFCGLEAVVNEVKHDWWIHTPGTTTIYLLSTAMSVLGQLIANHTGYLENQLDPVYLSKQFQNE
jgi:hypothetical protein